jgi:hypothetical protein
MSSYVIIGGVVTGAAWYTYRLAMGSNGASLPGLTSQHHLTLSSCSSRLDEGQSHTLEYNQTRREHKIDVSQSEIEKRCSGQTSGALRCFLTFVNSLLRSWSRDRL